MSEPRAVGRGGWRPGRGVLALAVFAGGAVAGAVIGVEFALVAVGVPEVVEWMRGASPQTGLVLVAAMVGAVVGSAIGAAAGVVGCATVAIAWALRLPRWAVGVLGGTAVAGTALGIEVSTATWHPQTVALAVLAAFHAAAGLAAVAHLGGGDARQ